MQDVHLSGDDVYAAVKRVVGSVRTGSDAQDIHTRLIDAITHRLTSDPPLVDCDVEGIVRSLMYVLSKDATGWFDDDGGHDKLISAITRDAIDKRLFKYMSSVIRIDQASIPMRQKNRVFFDVFNTLCVRCGDPTARLCGTDVRWLFNNLSTQCDLRKLTPSIVAHVQQLTTSLEM